MAMGGVVDAIQERIAEVLAGQGIALDQRQWEQLDRHVAEVRRWNRYASLVSVKDAEDLWARHVADSLSIAAYVREAAGDGKWLDIGSGGGFPAIPVSLAVPALRGVLLERSVKKCGILRRVVGKTGLVNTEVRTGVFPDAVEGEGYTVVTARAVEKPGELHRALFQRMGAGTTYFRQGPLEEGEVPERFHVERIDDDWSQAGLRRGPLYRIRAE